MPSNIPNTEEPGAIELSAGDKMIIEQAEVYQNTDGPSRKTTQQKLPTRAASPESDDTLEV